MCAWETFFPKIVFLPQLSQTRAMTSPFGIAVPLIGILKCREILEDATGTVKKRRGTVAFELRFPILGLVPDPEGPDNPDGAAACGERVEGVREVGSIRMDTAKLVRGRPNGVRLDRRRFRLTRRESMT